MDDNKSLLQKADLALADLAANSGILQTEQADVFIRTLLDSPTIINQCRVIPMNAPERRINRIGFGDMITRAARQSAGTRKLTEAERARPQLGQLLLNTKEIIAQVNLPYETLEDNIERGNLQNTIISLIGERVALDLEHLILNGDPGYVDADPNVQAFMRLTTGVLNRVTSNTVNGTGLGTSASLFSQTIKALPTKYRRNRDMMRFYVPMDVEQDYRLAVSNRGSNLGDAILTTNQALPVFGVPMRGIAVIPDTKGIFTDPKNIMFGIWREIRMEFDKDIESREYIIVLTARVGLQLEEEEAIVKITNIGA